MALFSVKIVSWGPWAVTARLFLPRFLPISGPRCSPSILQDLPLCAAGRAGDDVVVADPDSFKHAPFPTHLCAWGWMQPWQRGKCGCIRGCMQRHPHRANLAINYFPRIAGGHSSSRWVPARNKMPSSPTTLEDTPCVDPPRPNEPFCCTSWAKWRDVVATFRWPERGALNV